uniref:Uncharacterized protein n=1 Tax=Clostridium botulinum TaxID=1491 RepID=A0A140B454_CLOBO|nr:hypothetical protein [Clostridium botulinum]
MANDRVHGCSSIITFIKYYFIYLNKNHYTIVNFTNKKYKLMYVMDKLIINK